MKRIRTIVCVMWSLMLLTACSSSDNDFSDAGVAKASQKLHAVARQSADASFQYKAEMPLFSLNDVKSFNTKTGEMKFKNVKFDSHLFQDVGCKYRVYFYDGDDLLFDAVAVSWFSSVGYFDQLTFQCDVFGPDETWDISKSHFYLSYGYPGTISGDKSIEKLKQKNAAGMERFIKILQQTGKIVN